MNVPTLYLRREKTTLALFLLGARSPQGHFRGLFLRQLLQISDKAVLLPVQPEHVGIMVIPERHDENNTSAQSLTHFLRKWGKIHKIIKGSLKRDFRLQVCFVNQCPPGPWVCLWDRFDFFRKFSEIIANGCCSAVSMTPAIKEKNFQL